MPTKATSLLKGDVIIIKEYVYTAIIHSPVGHAKTTLRRSKKPLAISYEQAYESTTYEGPC